MNEICMRSLSEQKKGIQSKEFKVEELVKSCLQRVELTEPRINGLLYLNQEQALEQAREMDKQGPKEDKPLWGIPVVVKDVLAAKGMPATCSSKMLESFVPFYDSEAVSRLKQAGAIILAKSNMDEFAMGSSTENSAFQTTKNPWDLSRVPGGSSGGSAASTAACQSAVSLGTDTGGSIRQPAAFCGIVGLKPTYGRVSRFGLIAYGSSLDQIGPLSRNVADAAAVLELISGHDPKDSTSSPVQVKNYLSQALAKEDLKGVRLGVPKEYWGEGLEEETKECCQKALKQAEAAGAELVEVSLPHSPYAIAAYYIIVMAEASSNLARYDGVRYGYRNMQASELLDMYVRSRSEGFGDEVKRRIILGTYVLSSGYYDAYYKKAAQVRRLIQEDYKQAFMQCDLLVGPAAPSTAFKIGEKTDDPLQMYLTDIYTNPLNLTGYPGLCLPVGLGRETKMPVGLQLLGPAFSEENLFKVGRVLETSLEGLPQPSALKGLE